MLKYVRRKFRFPVFFTSHFLWKGCMPVIAFKPCAKLIQTPFLTNIFFTLEIKFLWLCKNVEYEDDIK